jgi:hypothetical protein
VLRLASGETDALSGCMISVDDDLDALIHNTAAIKRDELCMLRLGQLPSFTAPPA